MTTGWRAISSIRSISRQRPATPTSATTVGSQTAVAQRSRCFAGDGRVGGPGGDDRDQVGDGVGAQRSEKAGPRQRAVVDGAGKRRRQASQQFVVEAGEQEADATLADPRQDRRNLLGRLAFAEDRLIEPDARRAGIVEDDVLAGHGRSPTKALPFL